MRNSADLRTYSPLHHPTSAGESSATPTLESCRNAPNRYAEAMEKHFGHDMAKLHVHIKQRPEAEQKAVIDGSKAFRDFLGIRDPNSLSKKLFGSSSPSQRIAALDEPAALVMAAIRSDDKGRVLRSLTRLDASLDEIKINTGKHFPGGGYTKLVEQVLDKLAQELDKLGTGPALEIAVSIFEKNKNRFLNFDKKTLVHIISAMNEAQKKNVSGKLKTSMANVGHDAFGWKEEKERAQRQSARNINNTDRMRFERRVISAIPQGRSAPPRSRGETSNQERSENVGGQRINDTGRRPPERRVRFDIQQERPAPPRHQGETSNSARQHPFLRRSVAFKEDEPISHTNQSTQTKNNFPKVSTELLKAAKPRSAEEGASFKVRLLENSGKQPGRFAVFGERLHPATLEKMDLFAPFTTPMELAGMNTFVRCADGEIRRYPGSHGHYTSENQIKKGQIYDSERQHIKTHIAGYKFDARDGSGAFEVNGIKQKPIFKGGDVEVYKLGRNRHMIPQPNFTSCTYACENMLLMDQGYLSPDKLIRMPENSKRETEHILHSIKKNTGGVEPIVLNITFDLKKTNSDAIKRLQKEIKERGPCIIGEGGHARILDEIHEEKGKYFFTIRDPFHGTCNVIKGQQALFIKNLLLDDRNEKRELNAVFLPPKIDSDAKFRKT